MTAPARSRPVASNVSPAAIAVSLLLHAALGAAAALFAGWTQAPAPHVVVPVEVAFEAAATLTANEPAPPGGEAAAAPEPAVASSGNDAATPVDRAPLAPAMPKVAAAGPPQPTASERRVEAAPRPPEAHGLMRDVPPPPAKPKLREAADDKLDGLRGLATPAGGPLAEAVAAGGQMARAIDRGKSDASDEPSDAYAIPHGNPPPAYPDLARRRGWEGRVVLRVTVDATGRAAAVAVGSTSGHAVLDAAAAAAVRNWRFEPARLAGVPVIAAVDVPVSFRLTD